MPLPETTKAWAQQIQQQLFSGLQKSAASANIPITSSLMDDFKEEFQRDFQLPEVHLSSKTKKEIAAELYYGLRFRYGFEESLETGNWVPWPEQCKQANCYGQAIATYAVAQQCGLSPTLIEFSGFRKQDTDQTAGHSFVVVDVGEEKPEFWVIDQAYLMYGPVQFGRNIFTVENLAARAGRTYKADYNTKQFEFLSKTATDEEDIVQNVHASQADPESVLISGQRIAILYADSWQSEEALEVPWYVKFLPSKSLNCYGDIVSRLIIARPGIKSRGLEFKIALDEAGGIVSEKVYGYYCEGMVWADFTKPALMVDLSLEELSPLLEGLSVIPLEERAQFELELMRESSSPHKQRARVEAARRSLERIQHSQYGAIGTAFSIVEALYQQAKGSRAAYLSPGQRDAEASKLKTIHPLFDYYVSVKDELRRTTRIRERHGIRGQATISAYDRARLLRPEQIEDRRLVAFLALETEHERLEHILLRKPTFLNDALDRLVFYERKIKGRETEIQTMAEKTFGSRVEQAIFAGYSRIFAEFLGHFAMAGPALTLREYKPKIIEKITSTR